MSGGEAKTSKVLLTEATLMIGPRAKVFELTPELHSLGLTKAVKVDVTHGFAELTQGVTNQVAFRVNNSIESMVSAEVYEYTARNLAYGAQIDASGTDYDESTEVYTLSAAADDQDTDITLTAGQGSDWAAGDFAVVQVEGSDTVGVVKIASIATDTLTFASGYKLPEGVTFATATTKVYRVAKPIMIGTNTENVLMGAKIVGLLPESKKPITLIFPKLSITKGFSLSFDSQNFANMPFEFKPLPVLPGEAFYDQFRGNKQAMALPA